MIRASSIRAGVSRTIATLRSRREALLGALTVEIHPAPDERREGTENTRVLHHLARMNPALLALRGGDVDAAVRAAARSVFSPRTSTLRELATAAGPAVARALAARLRSGAYVTNTTETTERKARAGLGTTPGVATGALADSLEAAIITVP